MSTDPFAETRRCERCGAVTHDLSLVHCEYCGTKFVDYQEIERVEKARLERFERLRRSGVYQELLRYEPDEPDGKRFTAETLFIVTFITVILGITTLGFLASGLFSMLAPLPVALLLFMLYHIFKKPKAEHSGAPLTRQMFLAGPTSSRITGMQGSQAETEVKVTLFDEENRPHEYVVHPRAQDELGDDVLGVAFLRGDTLIEFYRVAEETL